MSENTKNQSVEVGGLPPLDQRERLKRRREWIAAFILMLIVIALSITEFRLTKFSSSLPLVYSIFFFGLLNVNIILLLALLWLVLRNIGKLMIERRRKVLGARLKTKLVAAFLSFSIIPTLVLFLISALYINSSFDKWFSLKIQNTLQASLDITNVYYKSAEQRAMHFSESLTKNIEKRFTETDRLSKLSETIAPAWISDLLATQLDVLALDSVEFYSDPFEERYLSTSKSVENDQIEAYPRLTLDLLERGFSGESFSVVQNVGSGDLIRSVVPIRSGHEVVGLIDVNAYIPVSLVSRVDEISSVFADYKDTNPLKYPIKTAYFVILIMITMVIIFVAIWIGFYMAKELTYPIERLVYGAQSVGSGNLDVTIAGTGHDEIAVLVESFNNMTADLRLNREKLNQANEDIEKRRLQLETVLANVGTGVIVVGRDQEITTFNRAVAQILGFEPSSVISKSYREVLSGQMLPLVEAIERAFEPVVLNVPESPEVAQWSVRRGEQTQTLLALASPLHDPMDSKPWGVVAVIEDLSQLMKAQREMAWREVARRIAHEIKNPLTPIKLSAQRLQRRLSHIRGKEGLLLQECTDIIVKHTDEMRDLVNEFSNFARLPEVNPAPNHLNEALIEVLKLYQQAHASVSFQIEPDAKLPTFDFDRDQIKRVVINLLDNAISAMSQITQKQKEIRIETHFNQQLQIAAIIVKDNGPGMGEEVRERVFEPYFSTKKGEGTGLGLAITKRIVNDHHGFIRVQSAEGEGTVFTIELPTVRISPAEGV